MAPGDDPLGACAELWAQGQLPDPGTPRTPPQPVPPLVVCISPGGAYEVYPGPDGLCAALGLAPVDISPDPYTAVVTELSSRIADEVNLAECAPAADVEERVQTILNDLGLETWTVVAAPGSETAECVKAEVDPTARHVQLSAF